MTRRTRSRLISATAVAVVAIPVAVTAILSETDGCDTAARQTDVRVVLIEGRTMFDYAATLDAAGVTDAAAFLAACRDPRLLAEFGIRARDAEGFLFPDTYRFHRNTPAQRVVRRLLANFRARVDPLLAAHRARLDRLGRVSGADPLLAAVIVASIVEAETPVPAERPLVASVAWNRLAGLDPRVRKLEMDPTVGYGCRRRPALASCTGWTRGEPTRRMLDDASNPYNTYVIEGLPPGPIGNPGLASIEAVLEAKPTRYLYFVARGDGTHEFSRTSEEHRAAVRKWLGR